jgi:hypothetical protein
MDNEPRDRTSSAPGRRRPPYPLHKIVAAVARDETDGVVAALGDAGFARDRVEVVTADDVPDLAGPVGGTGLRGLLTRLNLSLGDDLDELEQARQELMYGHSLVLVMVDGGAEQERARTVLHQHGGHAMHYFGRWTITTLEGDAH